MNWESLQPIRNCTDAKKIDVISYDEMIEMTSLGAKVLQAVRLICKKHNVNIRVRSSIDENEGTLITKEAKAMEEAVVTYVIPIKRSQNHNSWSTGQAWYRGIGFGNWRKEILCGYDYSKYQ